MLVGEGRQNGVWAADFCEHLQCVAQGNSQDKIDVKLLQKQHQPEQVGTCNLQSLAPGPGRTLRPGAGSGASRVCGRWAEGGGGGRTRR
jgi:hypothetical protein